MTDYGPGPCERCGEDIESHTKSELKECISKIEEQEPISSGNAKADDFMDEAEDAGWEDIEFSQLQDGSMQVDAFRNFTKSSSPEHIGIRFSRRAFLDGKYTNGGYSRTLRNVADARLRLYGEPLNPPEPKSKTSEPEVETNGSIEIRILPRILPFDLDTAYDDEIIDAIRGRKVIWWNTLTLDYERAEVAPANQRKIKIEETSTGRAVLTFVSPEGFRSVALDNLVQVK